MKRILIIGSNGAGKSTFSYQLAERTHLPFIHIDRLYWRNNWEVTPRQEFEELVCAQAQKPEWIIEGNNIGSLDHLLKKHWQNDYWASRKSRGTPFFSDTSRAHSPMAPRENR